MIRRNASKADGSQPEPAFAEDILSTEMMAKRAAELLLLESGSLEARAA